MKIQHAYCDSKQNFELDGQYLPSSMFCTLDFLFSVHGNVVLNMSDLQLENC